MDALRIGQHPAGPHPIPRPRFRLILELERTALLRAVVARLCLFRDTLYRARQRPPAFPWHLLGVPQIHDLDRPRAFAAGQVPDPLDPALGEFQGEVISGVS